MVLTTVTKDSFLQLFTTGDYNIKKKKAVSQSPMIVLNKNM